MKKTLTMTILFTLLSSLPALAQCETSNVTVLAGMQGVPGNTNGNGAAASFNRPDSVSVDRLEMSMSPTHSII